MMLSSSLRASLITLIASMVVVSAVPAITIDVDLTVTLSLPGSDGDGSENMKVITTVANTGDKTLKLLKDPRGILESFPEDSFTVTDAADSHPPFIGAKVNYSPTYAAGLGDSSAYIILPPGTSTNVIHDLTAAYDFTKSGTGEYSVEPSNLFTIVDTDGTLKDVYATVGNTAELKLSSGLPASRVHDKRAVFERCSANQQSQITTAISSAHSYARDALSYFSGAPSATPRFTAWFGKYSDEHRAAVHSHFFWISQNNFSDFKYDCWSCTMSDTFAWVGPYRYGLIHLCPPFWDAPTTGTDSKAGALIQAASQFESNGGGTKDSVHGQTNCTRLAINEPNLAIDNADSHKYFAENNPPLA